MSGLVFYPKSHRYKLDGEWVPGMTTILGVLDKPGLLKWAAAEVAGFVADNPEHIEALYAVDRQLMVSDLKAVPWRKRDDAATRGTKFHQFAERILLGEEVDVPADQVPLVEQALRFMDDYAIVPVEVEQACASREHRWAGTWDLVADHNRGPRSIFDWKSGKRIYASAVFQMNGYAHSEFYGMAVEKPTADLDIEAAYGIHVQPDGYEVYPLEFGPHVYDEFLAIRRVYDINKRAEGDWREPGSGYVGVPIPLEVRA